MLQYSGLLVLGAPERVPGELAFELEGFKIKVASLPRFKILGFSSGRRGLRVVNSTPGLVLYPRVGSSPGFGPHSTINWAE